MSVKADPPAAPEPPAATESTAVAGPPLAAAPRRIRSSAIRDLLAVAARPEIISLAGGLPAPETFPVDHLTALAADVLAEPGALQYGISQGIDDLRSWVGDRLGVDPEGVVVTHGSQQAIELLTRALVDPGTPVFAPDPCYLGALQAFGLSGARVVGIPADEDGMRVDLLADALRTEVPAFVYVVAAVDNPTGSTLAAERGAELARLADHYGFWVVDDDPYGELRWAAGGPPPLRTRSDRVITLGTTSKVLAPGFRVGWAATTPELAATLVLLKQAVDLQTTSLTQHLAARALAAPGFFDEHLVAIRACYQERCEALAAALRRHLGDRITFREPEGGMFLWARLAGVDTAALLDHALAAGVAFVPGREFAVTAPADDALRLSFATASPVQLDEAARRLAAAVAAYDAGVTGTPPDAALA